MLQSRIRRGHLDRQVTLIQKIVVSNTTNEDELTGWERVDTNPDVWAKVEQKQGNEVVVADQIQSIIKTNFIIDWRNDITAANRIVLDTRQYNIISVTEHESSRKGFLVIAAEAIPNQIFT